MNIILIGFMGTGKTAVGKRLAKRLDWPFVDVDQLIETGAAMSIAEIFTKRREAFFRRLEQRQIARVIRGQHQVVAVGGGAFVNPENRRRLQAGGSVVCLTARPRAILTRVGRRIVTRPLLAGHTNTLARIQQLLAQRSSAYARADVTIDTTTLTVDQVVEEIWQRVSPRICRSWQYVLDHSGKLGGQYGGQYVVVAENRVIASGGTQLEAYQHACLRRVRGRKDRRGRQAARKLGTKADVGIYYIPLPRESLTAF